MTVGDADDGQEMCESVRCQIFVQVVFLHKEVLFLSYLLTYLALRSSGP